MEFKDIIKEEKQKPYYAELKKAIDAKYENGVVYPPKNLIFNAFSKCSFENLKVVILGQDPYHGPNQAMGLSFSTPKDIKNPPSMVNIFKEIQADTGNISICQDGDLTPWAQQGVLLLNTILTVDAGAAKSHHNLGWEIFSDNIIKIINEKKDGVVFMLWGSNAISKSSFIDKSRHLVLSAPHPSPLSAYRGFFGCSHFTQANNYLQSQSKEPILW
jgi:uracil-DNA glycosylase